MYVVNSLRDALNSDPPAMSHQKDYNQVAKLGEKSVVLLCCFLTIFSAGMSPGLASYGRSDSYA